MPHEVQWLNSAVEAHGGKALYYLRVTDDVTRRFNHKFGGYWATEPLRVTWRNTPGALQNGGPMRHF